MRVCAGVYAMQVGMHRRVGAGLQVLCGYVCVQVWYAMQDGVRIQAYATGRSTNTMLCMK